MIWRFLFPVVVLSLSVAAPAVRAQVEGPAEVADGEDDDDLDEDDLDDGDIDEDDGDDGEEELGDDGADDREPEPPAGAGAPPAPPERSPPPTLRSSPPPMLRNAERTTSSAARRASRSATRASVRTPRLPRRRATPASKPAPRPEPDDGEQAALPDLPADPDMAAAAPGTAPDKPSGNERPSAMALVGRGLLTLLFLVPLSFFGTFFVTKRAMRSLDPRRSSAGPRL